MRRIFLIVLMLAMPFQATVGATGLICAQGAHHSLGADAADDGHDVDAPTHEHHGLDALGTHVSPEHDNTAGSHHGPGKCNICSECCFSAAAIPASLPDFVRPDATLQVAATVAPALTSRAGDGLFRPPRTTTH
ncbi:MAG: hypothetical protein M3007_05695 [Candidatus Eremiobacteraeota bacterium]|nr:hypothetical protein [Candidatus Eremiobacteraeota bacterium]